MKHTLFCVWLALFTLGAAVGVARERDEFLRRSLIVLGSPREVLVRAPLRKLTPPRALVLLLHGHGGSAAQLVGAGGRVAPYREWTRIADREQLLLAAPEGTRGPNRRQGWNDCRADATTNPHTNDVEFLSSLVAKLVREYRISPSSVFVVGTSNGGQMALRMAIERPALVRAVAAVAAAMPAHSDCAKPTAPVPVLFMNGTEDPYIPYEGGSVGEASGRRGTVLSAAASVAAWTKLAGVSSPPDVMPFFAMGKGAYGRVVRYTYARDDRPTVVLYRVEGGGHAEPSRSERYPWPSARVLGPQNVMIEMAEEVWNFFSAQIPR